MKTYAEQKTFKLITVCRTDALASAYAFLRREGNVLTCVPTTHTVTREAPGQSATEALVNNL